VGFRSPQQVAGIIGALKFRLSEGEMSEIEQMLHQETAA
jgi:aryl-alcohol dehydrogenase-like predicted oxidoreductase